MVYFVGAGPGAKDLITVRGMEYLKQADVIIYAGSLVNPELLEYAKKECRIYNSAAMHLDEVLAVMEETEAKHQMTVRLHTGDPSIYGAIKEQMDALRERNISYEVCPGVSSMSGAAASLQVEYTLPEVSQTIIISRAQGRTAVPEKEQLRGLAAHGATMILFLSSGLVKKVQSELLAGGLDEKTPVAVVYKATWEDERILRTTLKDLPAQMEQEQIHKTALIIVGDVLDCDYEKSKLYDPFFSTEYREGRDSKEAGR